MMTNRFSIAMCTYNGSRFLEEQLASIASQTRVPDELVVCDDRSEDQTASIVERFAASAPFSVRFQINEQRLGSTRNFAKAITLCEGNLIALADQDDVWLAEKLEMLELEFDRDSEVGLVFSDANLVDSNLRPLNATLWERIGFDAKHRERVRKGRALDVLLPGWSVTGATMAFRASYRELALDIPDELPMIHDGWIALVIAAVAKVIFIDRPLINYRQHAGQQIGVPEKSAPLEGRRLSDLRAAASTVNSFDELIEIGLRVRQRLVEHNDRFDSATALALLDERLTHMRARAQLSRSPLKRLASIWRELSTHRYHRYSNGFSSAVKDLIT
jgi:hypothetical protein